MKIWVSDNAKEIYELIEKYYGSTNIVETIIKNALKGYE